MKALLFLYVRVFVNGIKRSFSSPLRTLGVLLFIFYQLMFLPRMMFTSQTMSSLPMQIPKLPFPPTYIVEAVVFAAFVALTILFALNMFNQRGTFRAADVDVLFPTPIDPKLVLTIKVLRDIWLTMVMPLVFAIIFYRPAKMGWANLFSGIPNPASANSVFRVAMVAYLLSAIIWVWVGYGLTLSLSKPDIKTDRLRNALSWLVFLGLTGYGVWMYLGLKGLAMPGALIDLARAPHVRVVFFLADAASKLTMAPITANPVNAVIGSCTLLGVMIAAILFARSRTEWLYEQATMRTAVTETTRKLSRSGDIYGLAARNAQTGKIKSGKVGVLQRMTVKGPWALLWKEILITRRTGLVLGIIYFGTNAFLSVIATMTSDIGAERTGLLLLSLQATLLLAFGMGHVQAGFIESLRRIDLIKPIPFKSQVIVTFEVINKCIIPVLSALLGLALAVAINHMLWPYAVAGLFLFPGFMIALSAVSLLLVVLMPDVEDPTQRSLRGLATMLGILACAGPPVLVLGLLLFLKVPIAVASIPTAGVMLGLAWLMTHFAGKIYEDFNPAD